MNKGFTLIELLAVIVILAVIALIATPIVLSIINDTKESAVVRSAEFYISAVENSIMQHNMKSLNTLTPRKCTILESGNVNCDGVELEVEVDGEKPTSGEIIFNKGSLEYVEGITFDGGKISSNQSGELVKSDYRKKCVAVTENTKTTGNIPKGNIEDGDEYICTVKQGTEYHFFVVGVEGDKVNLILDRNINSDGTLATVRIAPSETGIYNMVDWKSSNTDVGPTVANSFVKEATSTWINIDNINEQYTDENKPYSLSSSAKGPSYGTIVLTGRARLPKYSEVAGDNKCQPKTISGEGNCPLWLINYSQWVSTSASKPTGMTTEGFTNILGYWLLASANDYTNVAWYVFCGNGMLTYTDAINTGTQKRGIRPVIEVYKDNLQH